MESVQSQTTSTPLPELYKPLDSGQFQIRCLKLSPGEFEDPICGALEIASLEATANYEALSYVWGANSSPVPMLIDGVEVSITPNLDAALRHLRNRKSSRCLWVDALCINQADLKEKADQVKFMGLVYSKAIRAIVWLGSADTSFESVKAFLDELDRTRTYLESFASESKEAIPTRSKQHRNDPEFSLALRKQDRPTEVIRGLLELFSRPYWERVWIIQEISKASDVEIWFGRFRVHLNPLLSASRNLKNLSGRTRILLRTIVRFRAQEQGYGGFSTILRMSLFDALVASRYSLATDSRDKIYALLGLTSDGSNLVPMPTYASSVEKIYRDLTAAIIRSQQRSNVILLANWASLQNRIKDTARWCIDWADLGYHLPPWLTPMPKSVAEVITCRLEFDGSTLITKGQFIATVKDVQGTSRVSLPSAPVSPQARFPFGAPRPTNVPSLAEEAKNVLSRITSDLVYRLAPGFRSTTGLSQIEITDSLARMIRDVDKREASADYDIRCVEDVLDQLGSLPWQKYPLWEWARRYNHARASEDIDNYSSTASPINAIPNPSPARGPRQRHSPAIKASVGVGLSWSPGRSRVVTPPKSRSGTESPSSLVLVQTSSPKTLEAPWSPRPRLPSQPAFHFWEDTLSVLDAVPEFKLRFAVAESVASKEHLILVCDGARPGDSIYQIESANLPVILRESYRNISLIGEACISRQETGEWDKGRVEAMTDDLFGVKPGLTKLNITLPTKISHRKSSYESLYGE